jgi:hypothetical protein
MPQASIYFDHMNDRASSDLTSAALDDRSEVSLLPLSTAQQAVLLDQLLHPQLPCYNVGGVGRFEGAVRVDLLEGAPPLHAMPTGLGDTIYAFELAKHMGLDVPMYAHPWPQQIPSTWEQFARETAVSIRSVQATGPYRLLEPRMSAPSQY